MLARGRTAEAAELIDPLTDAPPANLDHYPVHGLRAEIDLLRGDVEAAAGAAAADQVRRGPDQQHRQCRRDRAATAEVAVWAGRPADGLAEVREVLARYQATDWTIQCGWLLVVGMRACAELAGQGRARRDESATQAALAAADDLVAWVDRTGGTPFTDHPYVATIPAARANWNAERSRLVRRQSIRRRGRPRPTPGAPSAARTAPPTPGGATRRPGCSPATRLLRSPTRSGPRPPRQPGMSPLLAAIRALAERAHIPLDNRARRRAAATVAATPYGLTDREVLVLRLLVAGRSNRRDRRGAIHQPEDGERPRDQHPAQARRLDPGAGRRPRRTCRPARSLLRRIR